ncbi:HdeD family acid-resistance protein [Cellulomonas sp. HZM]|uniref:HdeD family acid-resistance protein n=1 Tax=Cellulomonas sp. HZM TaxID=1454010 RepID=UPI000492FD4A|nr:DUF308 domain-containing protein [Cellulomonas sp. HZM]
MTYPTPAEVSAQLRRFWWLPVLRGVLLLVLGLFMLFHPFDTLTALAWLVGLFTIVDGVLMIVSALADRKDTGVLWPVVGGLLAIAVGVVVLIWPAPTVRVVFYLIAAWIVILGIAGIVASIAAHHQDSETWYFPLTFGLVSLLIGLLLLTNPQTSVAVVMVILGMFTLVAGVVLVVTGFAARSVGKRLETAGPTVIEV